MKRSLQTALAAAALVAAGHAAAQITFYSREDFRGRSLTTHERIWNLERADFDDRASSIVVERGQWEVCDRPRFEGRCAILSRGGYPSLRELGMDDRVSSVRPVEGRRQQVVVVPAPQPVVVAPQPVAVAPQPVVVEERWQRRGNETVYEAPVTSARAVVGPPNQRCWVERQQVAEPATPANNIGGAVIGGIVGGILGHQVGGGHGKDIATAGGAIAGAVIGSKVATTDGNAPRVVGQDVQRCETVNNTKPEYWDVNYQFRGVEHRMQMTTPPGRVILVNAQGEPRL
ncbi:hypothetical protein GCM10027034_01300 [Ramlibacter solisilvae]|uniref:Beta/gamma crystallin 'Greek key' domain-containing protein n=1 Tax=Ramlibacter tataouinensis TaxID=94132 RepID=A0A127JUR0_9BURK|nr:beta/gamma crystallin-related protein [Ramlibacter tataouinensis]AMO21752.1 hypothetical protein UC35_01265 [Ramlibacter tataouinensis]